MQARHELPSPHERPPGDEAEAKQLSNIGRWRSLLKSGEGPEKGGAGVPRRAHAVPVDDDQTLMTWLRRVPTETIRIGVSVSSSIRSR